MIVFYAPNIENTLTLPESDSKHCVKVLRSAVGDIIHVIDGKGNIFTCSLVDNNPRAAAIEIIDKQVQPLHWSYPVTIAVAPTKNMDRMEWLVEKLTEIGVNRIVLLKCQRSERKEVKTDRLKKIAISAMKQSLKAWLPEITEVTALKQFLEHCSDSQKFVCYCHPSIPRQLLAKSLKPNEPVSILIGPEGDFSPEEIQTALAKDWIPVTLGDNRLRTETAALVAVDTVHIFNQING